MRGWLLILWIAGCGPSSDAVAPSPSAPAATPATAPSVGTRLVGAWQRVLTDDQQADLRMLDFAFSDPMPSEEQASELVMDELRMKVLKFILAFRRGQVEHELVRYREMWSQLRKSRVTFTRDTVRFEFGTAVKETRYMVVRSGPDEALLRLEENAEQVTARFQGGTLHLTNGHDLDQKFVRAPAPDATIAPEATP